MENDPSFALVQYTVGTGMVRMALSGLPATLRL